MTVFRIRLDPTPDQTTALQRLARQHEHAQLKAQLPVHPGVSLAARIERGELTIEEGCAWLSSQPGLLTVTPGPLTGALTDLLNRRAGAAAAVMAGLPLPPARQISGPEMIRIGSHGLQVQGCPGELQVMAEGIPAWAAGSIAGARVLCSDDGFWQVELTD